MSLRLSKEPSLSSGFLSSHWLHPQSLLPLKFQSLQISDHSMWAQNMKLDDSKQEPPTLFPSVSKERGPAPIRIDRAAVLIQRICELGLHVWLAAAHMRQGGAPALSRCTLTLVHWLLPKHLQGTLVHGSAYLELAGKKKHPALSAVYDLVLGRDLPSSCQREFSLL